MFDINWIRDQYIKGLKEFKDINSEDTGNSNFPNKEELRSIMKEEKWKIRRQQFEQEQKDVEICKALNNGLENEIAHTFDLINIEQMLQRHATISRSLQSMFLNQVPFIKVAMDNVDWGMMSHNPKQLLETLKLFIQVQEFALKVDRELLGLKPDEQTITAEGKVIEDMTPEEIREELEALENDEITAKYIEFLK